MLGQPSLSQSKQPKDHYDYDGLSGGWLWFPWWVHLMLAILFWPMCWWLLPKLPFQNVHITEFLFDYRLKLAIFLSVATSVTALMSFLKARKVRIKRIDESKKRSLMEKSVGQKTTKKITSVNKASKSVTTVEDKKIKEKVVAPMTKTKIKPKVAKAVTKGQPRAKRTTQKKKDDSQLPLDF